MSQSLSRWQAAAVGLVVVLAAATAAIGLAAVAAKQGVWVQATELSVGLLDASDMGPGTPVRVRGVEAGQVVGIDYPDADGPAAVVTVRMQVATRFANRIYADATVRVLPAGLLGQKVVAIAPGTPAAGLPPGGRLTAVPAPDITQAADRLAAAADEATALLREVRAADGTVAKLLNDDELYRDLKGLSTDSRELIRKTDAAVDALAAEAVNVRGLVADGRETLRSVKQGTDAVQRLPVVRGYVEDPVAALTRPDARRDARTYSAADLFEPGTAILHAAGRSHLSAAAGWVKAADPRAEVVVAARHDPADGGRSAAAAAELTRKQSEAAVEFLRAAGAHKLGWWSRRKLTAVGLGTADPPVADPGPLPAAFVQVSLYTPPQ